MADQDSNDGFSRRPSWQIGKSDNNNSTANSHIKTECENEGIADVELVDLTANDDTDDELPFNIVNQMTNEELRQRVASLEQQAQIDNRMAEQYNEFRQELLELKNELGAERAAREQVEKRCEELQTQMNMERAKNEAKQAENDFQQAEIDLLHGEIEKIQKSTKRENERHSKERDQNKRSRTSLSRSSDSRMPMTSAFAGFGGDDISFQHNIASPMHSDNLFHQNKTHATINLNASSTSTAGVPVQRNTDINRYFNSDIATECHLCEKILSKRIVSHYKKDHPESEVFASRLSQAMVDLVRSNKPSNTVYHIQPRFPEPIAHAHCYLCNEVKKFQAYYWIQHYATHTGEYMFRCRICDKMVSSQKHCDFAAERIGSIHHFNSHDLIAFVCLDCNYIQLNEKNMEKHQRNEHLYVGDAKRYIQVTLLFSRKKADPQRKCKFLF